MTKYILSSAPFGAFYFLSLYYIILLDGDSYGTYGYC